MIPLTLIGLVIAGLGLVVSVYEDRVGLGVMALGVTLALIGFLSQLRLPL